MATKAINGPQGNLSPDQIKALPGELMRAKPYTKHKVPTWVTKRLKADGRQLGSPSWLDHPGSVKASNGSEVFISEPYELTGNKLRAALDFADSIKSSVRISPVSSHYPGSTVRIEFWPDENVHNTDK